MRANDGVTVQLHLRLNWHYIDGGDKLASWLTPVKEPLVNKSWCGFCTGKKIICSLRNRHSVLQSSNPYPNPYTGWNTLFPEVMWNHMICPAVMNSLILSYLVAVYPPTSGRLASDCHWTGSVGASRVSRDPFVRSW